MKIQHQNLWDTVKAVLTIKLIALNSFLKNIFLVFTKCLTNTVFVFLANSHIHT